MIAAAPVAGADGFDGELHADFDVSYFSEPLDRGLVLTQRSFTWNDLSPSGGWYQPFGTITGIHSTKSNLESLKGVITLTTDGRVNTPIGVVSLTGGFRVYFSDILSAGGLPCGKPERMDGSYEISLTPRFLDGATLLAGHESRHGVDSQDAMVSDTWVGISFPLSDHLTYKYQRYTASDVYRQMQVVTDNFFALDSGQIIQQLDQYATTIQSHGIGLKQGLHLDFPLAHAINLRGSWELVEAAGGPDADGGMPVPDWSEYSVGLGYQSGAFHVGIDFRDMRFPEDSFAFDKARHGVVLSVGAHF